MEFGSSDGREEGKDNSVGVVEIYRRYLRHMAILFSREQFT